MPHKHTRRGEVDDKQFDLAPGAVAKPLSAFQHAAASQKKNKVTKNAKSEPHTQVKRKKDRPHRQDDTPRAFARLMQMQAGVRPQSGLDDGEARKSKKRKLDQNNEPRQQRTSATVTAPGRQQQPLSAAEELKILPGERMADFAARVNQALPMGGLTRKGPANTAGSKERQTKTEKRLHKMYAEWREEDARRKEKMEEFQEQQEEAAEEQEAALGGQSIAFPTDRKGKRKRMLGETATAGDEDPWAVLEERREKPKGLHDVVQAPPTLKTIPKEKFKVRNGAVVDVANVPANAGSLKRREELSDARREVIERYRSMMRTAS